MKATPHQKKQIEMILEDLDKAFMDCFKVVLSNDKNDSIRLAYYLY